MAFSFCYFFYKFAPISVSVAVTPSIPLIFVTTVAAASSKSAASSIAMQSTLPKVATTIFTPGIFLISSTTLFVFPGAQFIKTPATTK